MLKSPFTDPADTRVANLKLEDNPDVDDQVRDKCADAAALGYRLAGCYPHADRLVLVFQKPLGSNNVG